MKKNANNTPLVKGAVAGVVSLAMIFGGQALENAIQIPSAGVSKPAMADAEGELTPGTYTASADGFGGPVNVTLTVGEKGGIADIALEAAGETPEIGGAALETLKEQILTAQSSDIDGVAGASLTSGAVKTALADAIAAAGGPAVETEPEEEPAPAEEEATEETTVEEAAPVEEAAEEVPAETEEAPAEAGGYTAGTYTASELGFGGDVTVTLTVGEDGSISDVTVEGASETPEIGGKAVDTLAEQITAAQSADIDGVAGATLTSGAAKAAADKAIAQASTGTTETAETAEEAPAEAGAYTAGTYTASEYGFGGDVVVTLTVGEDGSISDVTVEGASETPEIGGKAVDTLAEQITAAQSADIDGVAGATLTSGAAKAAAAKAIAQASGTETGASDAAKPADGDLFIPGTYAGVAKGFGDDVFVGVTVTENEITKVKIIGDKETPNIGSFAVELMDDAIIEAQSPYVDTLSGATVTSNGILKATRDALTAAGADLSVFPTVTKVVADGEKKEETADTDILIIGAGGAGMTAAINAKQQGKEVILLEKMPYVGGNTTKATGGMNAAETKFQAEQEIEDSVQQFIDDTMAGGHDINDIDLVTKMAEESAGAIDWLDSIGAPLPKVSFSGGATNARIHAPADGTGVGEYLVTFFRNKLEEEGIDVWYNTEALELVMDGDKVVGAKAESEDTIYTITADAVILATGGFGASQDMIVQYREDLKGTVTTNAPGATGDGIKMAEAIGADLVDIDQIQLHPTVEQGTSMLITESVRGDGAILVNQGGKRFINELLTRDVVSAGELEQEGSYAYVVFDQQLRDGLKAVEKYVATGVVVQADSIEGLAEELGMDPAVLSETVETWNKAVADQKDEEFGRTTGMEADISVAPFYAIKIAPGIHHTMGGVKINTNAEVIDKDGNVIPGLFAAGEVTGGVHGGNRIGGNAVADIVVFGRIASDSAISYIGK